MSRYQDAWLDGIQLSSVHPAIIVQHISESAPKKDTKTAVRPGGGTYLISNNVTEREITISVAIRQARDFITRTEAYNALVAWAVNGGMLELSNRPGLEIFVTCKEPPSLGRLRDWAEDISITFVAYWYPYWVDKIAQTASASGTSGTVDLSVLGTWPGCLEADITPTDGTLTTVTMSVDADGINVSPISIASGHTLHLRYDERHLMHIEADGAQLMAQRYGVENIRLRPGIQTVTYEANTACTWVFKSRGVTI